MLSRTEIKSYTNTTTYNRGLNLYQMGRVESISVEPDEKEGLDHVEAVVKGSGQKRYRVVMDYMEEKSSLKRIGCTCPAFYSYAGICKHCVAVLLEYIGWKKRQGTIFEDARQIKQKLPAPAPKDGAGKKTSPGLRRLLERRQEKVATAVSGEQPMGTVELTPDVKFGIHGEVEVGFSIGSGFRYVVKDVLAFIQAISREDKVSYGKRLEFTHYREAFSPSAQGWLDFIQGWFRNQYLNWSMPGYSGYSSGKLRRILLSASELDDFMDRIGDGSFEGQVEPEESRSWRIAKEPLRRRLWIRGKDGGVELALERLYGVKGNLRCYYLKEGLVYPVAAEELLPINDFMDCMLKFADRTVFLQKEDVPLFCRELLPQLEKQFVCVRENFNEEDYGLCPVSFAFYLDAPSRDMVTCRPMARYGEREYPVFGNRTDGKIRDFVKEAQIGKEISSICDAYDEKQHAMAAVSDSSIYELLTEGMARMHSLGQVYVSDAWKRIGITPAPKTAVGISISGDLLQLQISAEDMSREQLLEILSSYTPKRRFYRLKNGNFVDLTQSDLGTLAEIKEGLGLTDGQLRQEKVELPRFRALYLDSELREKGGISVFRDRKFRSLVRNMKTVEDNDFEVPHRLEAVLREYQKRGFLWIKTLKSNGFGGILADDMGLGKTLQVIAFLESERIGREEGKQAEKSGKGEGPQNGGKRGDGLEKRFCLIVSPASLVFNWNSEIGRFAPELKVRLIVGSAAKRRELIEGAGTDEILLTSYDLLRRDLPVYETLQFENQVIDEAQYIKNHGTQTAKAVKGIRASFKLALTGTPVENRLSELWSIFDYLMPGFLYSYKRFREELEQPIVQNQEQQAMDRLQKLIRPFVLRRMKGDVLKDLPEKIEKEFFAKMEGEQQKLYDACVKRLQLFLDKQTEEELKTSKLQVLSELTRLRQICCDPALVFENYRGESAKLEACMELVENAVGSGHKLLLFSQFTTMLARIQRELEKRGISFYALTGATPKEERIRLAEAFNQDGTSVFCISLKAGGTGLNLTGADMVIHYDPWWNLAVQNQATDRAHRIGQKQVVTVYKLLTKGTIEENITRLQEKKRELAEDLLGGGGMSQASFSREELMELLRP